MSTWQLFGPAAEYWQDAWQRSILFLDILRQRGNIYREHNAMLAPNVLDFEAELVLDGRTLPRPVNYVLVRIVPPAGMEADPTKRPFIIVDPRAGHGPGIGGMKPDSQVGVTLAAGNPCYFVGFLPEPMPGQTLEDVWEAEAAFVAAVAERHPDSDGKPAIIANCQAGWQTAIMAATHPELVGPLLLAGSPLSYWAGVRGKNPMRYLGGVLGGTWLTALTGDLGAGIFDGANLVANFESLNPANTYWEKPYNVYSKVDTEGQRFLDFETWWGSPVLLNATEMQWIADNLFVGNKLSTGALRTSEGVRVDLREIKSPIVVFCSWGDNITPPQQALAWITDIYDHEREIVANGQTIVYTMHHTIGHLGIFVSGKVATKEHGEFTSCMDMIDLMPPGLYEAVITEVDKDMPNAALIEGRYLFTLQPRTIEDVRAITVNNTEDDQLFATAARVSEINRGLYRRYLGPTVRALASHQSAEAMRQMHPNRLRFAMFSDDNPMMRGVKDWAEQVRRERQPVAADNPLLALEKAMSTWITTSLEAYGNARDMMTERLFLGLYGSPLLQALTGLGPETAPDIRHIERDLAREAVAAQQRSKLEQQFEIGGPTEAALRSLVYVRLADGGSADERGFTVLKELRAAQHAGPRRTISQLKELVKEQYLLVRLDEERAVGAIPKLLPPDAEERRAALDALRAMVEARGALTPESQKRFARIEAMFDSKDGKDFKGARTARPAKRETLHG